VWNYGSGTKLHSYSTVNSPSSCGLFGSNSQTVDNYSSGWWQLVTNSCSSFVGLHFPDDDRISEVQCY
jgi:hypothetical protein